ncbi:MAG: DUF4388 domain-containing protein [Cyanobacteria bacterium P01_A01_bin.37]
MDISGTLNEFPLPEILQFLDRRRSVGTLSLDIFSDYYPELKPNHYAIWLNQGHIISVQREHCHHDIYSLAVRNEWISSFAAKRLKDRAPQGAIAGTYLESQGILNFGQLRELFFSEVVHRVEALCDIQNAKFSFQTTTDFPMNEMTGLTISAIKVAQQGWKGIGLGSMRSKNSLQKLRRKLFVSENPYHHYPSYLSLKENKISATLES